MTDYVAHFATSLGLIAKEFAQRIRKWREYNPYIIALNFLLIICSIVVSYYIPDKNWALALNIATAVLSTWLGFYTCVNIIEITNYEAENPSAAPEKKLSMLARFYDVSKQIVNVILFYMVYPFCFLTLSIAVIIYFINYMFALGSSNPGVTGSPLDLAIFIITLGGFIILVYSNEKVGDKKDIGTALKPLLLAVISFLALFIIIQMIKSSLYDTYIQSIDKLAEPTKTINQLFNHLVAIVAAIFICLGSIALAWGLIMSIHLIRKP